MGAMVPAELLGRRGSRARDWLDGEESAGSGEVEPFA